MARKAREWSLMRFKDEKARVGGWFVANEPQWQPGDQEEIKVREVLEGEEEIRELARELAGYLKDGVSAKYSRRALLERARAAGLLEEGK